MFLKVIVIDEWFPWPLESGKKIRTYNLITRLAKEYEIIYLAYANLSIEQEKATELERRGIKTIAVNDCRIKKWTIPFYLSVIMNFFSSKPYSTYYHIKKDFISKLKETIEQENPQLIHCEWTNLAPFLEYVDKIPTVITAHNIESDIWYRLASSGGNIFSRMVGRNQAHKIEKLERQWYPKVNLCIAVSDEDKKIIESYGASASIVENGVDVNYYSQIVSEAEDYSIAFTASFDTFSNQDGAYYFIEEIYPLIKQKQPHAKLKLIGKSPPERFWKYAHDRHNLRVNDIAQHVAGPNAGQLIHVTDQEQVRRRVEGLEQVIEQQQVEHTGFVDDQHVHVQRVFVVVLESLSRHKAQQAVARQCLGRDIRA